MSSLHQDQPLLDHGTALSKASVAVILLHGRGASARGMLALTDEVALPDVAYLAPQAADRSWYPQSFMAPTADNEPALSSALQVVGDTIAHATDAGLPKERIVLLGFSQGACLATEYTARHPQRYGGVVGLSGGLVGPEDTAFNHKGRLDDTPVFLGCSDQDPYIPLERVEETAAVFRRLGAAVTKRIYEGMAHTTNDDELQFVHSLLGELVHA
ncbi:MAG: phospholipase [Bacteroidetes bacterium SW_9_63_38]|nr:MAG: phospholipase [Bacteroidetes bacterium SW_9_63_38]